MRPRSTFILLTIAFSALCLISTGCKSQEKDDKAMNFGNDVKFLKSHTETIVLSDSSGKAKIAVAPALQGRVMTSTADGDKGVGFGWINRAYFGDVAAGKTNPHINPYGGEDRFWIGPEGGQFSIFFKKGDPFDYEHWHTPKFIDTEPFETVSTTSNSAAFRRSVTFENYSGTQFDIRIDRTVRLVSANETWRLVNRDKVDALNAVAFETENIITNIGQSSWTKEGGLLSIWILGMFNASPDSMVIIPIQPGAESTFGPPVNDDYFGRVPGDRLKVNDNIVYFKADANFRSKIGIPPKRTQPLMGSYDRKNGTLTIVQFTYTPLAKDYVNSSWKIQDNPYGGDVANSYNDGPPPTGGAQLGKFYELESSSAAPALSVGQSMRHVHRTFHFTGSEIELDKVARAMLGVRLDKVRDAFE